MKMITLKTTITRKSSVKRTFIIDDTIVKFIEAWRLNKRTKYAAAVCVYLFPSTVNASPD